MQMTDVQLLTAAIAVIFPVSMLIYSNSRITDAKEVLRAEMKALQVELIAEMRAGFERIENAIKVHELEHHRG